MFFLGFISFLQINFLPGWLLLTFLKLKTSNKLEKFIFSFALSWWLNYFLVSLLTYFNIYTRPTVIFIIIIELVLFIFTNHKSSLTRTNLKVFDRNYIIVFLPLLVLIFIYLQIFISTLLDFSIFSTWDAVVSWNRWATDWSKNIFPKLTWEYPQLAPSNWSLSYVLMGNPNIQFWNKLSMILFPVNTMLIFAQLALKKKNNLYLLGIPIFHLSLIYFYNFGFAIDGYVDIVLAFYSFLSFYIIFINHQQKYLLSLIFASAAAVSKQFGILMLGLISVLNYKNIIKNRPSFLFWSLLSLATISWYVYKEYQFSIGADTSNIDVLLFETAKEQSLGTNTNILPKILFGLNRLFGIYIEQRILFVFLVFLSLYACRQKMGRLIFFLFVLPFFLIWSIYFSYNNMNFIIAIPFLTLSCLIGLDKLISHINHQKLNNFIIASITLLLIFFIVARGHPITNINWSTSPITLTLIIMFLARPKKVPTLPFLSIFLTVICFIGIFFLKDTVLLSNQTQQQRKLGVPKLNEKIYEYNRTVGIKGKIITSYQYLCFLPDLKDYCIVYSLPLNLSEVVKNKASYILSLDTMLTPETLHLVNYNIKKGVFKQIFDYEGTRLIQIN